MKVDFKAIGKASLNTLNRTGEEVSTLGKNTANFIRTQRDQFIKNDTLKANLNKNTLIGAATIVGAGALAIKCIKGIVDKVKDIKNKD